jgi:hypothetical protein
MDIFLKYQRGLTDTFCPILDLELLGLKNSDVDGLLVPLNCYDKKKLYALLRSTEDSDVRRQLIKMNDLNGKMEIDVLADNRKVESSLSSTALSFTHDYLVHALHSLFTILYSRMCGPGCLHDTVWDYAGNDRYSGYL